MRDSLDAAMGTAANHASEPLPCLGREAFTVPNLREIGCAERETTLQS
jgi:hypothetical protein